MGMGSGAFGPFGFSGLGNITPFTYRDGYTYLSVLRQLIEQFNDLVGEYDELVVRLQDFETVTTAAVDSLRNDMAQFTSDVNKDMDKRFTILRNEMLAIIADATKSGTCFDPTTGRRDTPVSDALSHVYDYSRLFAQFARLADAAGITAATQQATGQTARHIDTIENYPTPQATLNGE